MKKKSIRSTLTLLLITASFASYIFLNTVSANATDLENPVQIEQPQLEDISKNNEANLPDIQLMKKAVELAKNILSGPH